MSTFYLGLGSNQGDRKTNLQNAISSLQACGDLTATSSIYETAPQYETSQAKFLNMVCMIESQLEVIELFEAIKSIEKQLGRILTYKNGPRVIDIDILYSPEETFNDDSLQVPHPRLAERAFVLVPFNEIAPNLYIPTLGKLSDLLSKLDGKMLSEVQLISYETCKSV